jgi:hypothetical protein
MRLDSRDRIAANRSGSRPKPSSGPKPAPFRADDRRCRDCARSSMLPPTPSGWWDPPRSPRQRFVLGTAPRFARAPALLPSCRRLVARDTTPRAKAPRDNRALSQLPASRASALRHWCRDPTIQRPDVRIGPKNKIIGIETFRPLPARPLDLRRADRRLDGTNHGRSDTVLKVEDVRYRTVVLIRPEVIAGVRRSAAP